MKAVLLIIELKFPVEHSQNELNAVLRRMPEGSQRVLHADKTIGFLIPPVCGPGELHGKLYPSLTAFLNYRLLALSGETYCKDRSLDPIEDWMDDFRSPTFRRRKGPQPQHVPLTQRRQRR